MFEMVKWELFHSGASLNSLTKPLKCAADMYMLRSQETCLAYHFCGWFVFSHSTTQSLYVV